MALRYVYVYGYSPRISAVISIDMCMTPLYDTTHFCILSAAASHVIAIGSFAKFNSSDSIKSTVFDRI